MKINIFYSSFIIALIFTLFVGVDARGQVTCPDGYQTITNDFYRVVTRAPGEKCEYQNPSLCHFRAYYCVRCDVTSPREKVNYNHYLFVILKDIH